ncbi:MAG TPA: zf-HC2 domain-containing protein [Candidatus Nanopelagicaceae bacterium]|nr:zf-HC2 domain-containing protein [Candidatus Nanopelagicaceae bacterium]
MVAVSWPASGVLPRALDGLTPEQNRAAVLHDIEGWKERDLAEPAGLPLATAKSHLRRGRQALVTDLASDLLDGQLDADQAALVEAHLAGCATSPNLYLAAAAIDSHFSRRRELEPGGPGAISGQRAPRGL